MAFSLESQPELCLQAVETYGSPLYLYDADRMEFQYKRLTKAFEGLPVRFNYACKALSNQAVLKLFHELGAGLDTVSIQEVKLGLLAGFEPKQIIFTPNSVGFQEFLEAVELGVVINIDNISILEQFGDRFGADYPISIRINPHIMAGGNANISTGHIDSKFGISIHQMRHVERVVQKTGLEVEGLHMHTGSDILDTEVFLQGADVLLSYAGLFPRLKFVDFGSGFKVPYHPDDLETDIEALAQGLKHRMADFYRDYGKEVELWFEPGKFLVSEAGKFLTRVNVVKHTTATVFAGVDSGFHHLIRPMLYRANHFIENLSHREGPKRIYTVVGMICETDTFASDIPLNQVHEGDILMFYNAGAYGFEMSMNYNARLRPAEVMIKNGKLQRIRKREVFEDLLRNQILD